MIRHRAAFLCFILSLCCFGRVLSQPVLPGIAGKAENGMVLLSWISQYDGLRAINVMRSADSTRNFIAIGVVKKLDKGVQAFVDGHPFAGRNFYRLSLVFKSGLTWTSDRCGVSVGRADIEAAHARAVADSVRFVQQEQQAKDASAAAADTPRHHFAILNSQDNPDSLNLITLLDTVKTGLPEKKKLTIVYGDPDESMVDLVRSRYIYIDDRTGHIRMNLPDDVATHHYAIRFYDDKKHVVIEVPHISAAHIVFDRHNFQHSGKYKFVIRRDVVELEAGYIEVE